MLNFDELTLEQLHTLLKERKSFPVFGDKNIFELDDAVVNNLSKTFYQPIDWQFHVDDIEKILSGVFITNDLSNWEKFCRIAYISHYHLSFRKYNDAGLIEALFFYERR